MMLFMDGFDKYGGPGSPSYVAEPLLMAGGWSSAISGVGLSSPLSGIGGSGASATLGAGATLIKSFSTNYPRLIGGFRFRTTGDNNMFVTLMEGSASQCTIEFIPGGGIGLRTGNVNGTIIQSTAPLTSAGYIHHFEWDITIGASAPYAFWLDTVSILSGTGATRTTTNNYTNAVRITGDLGAPVVRFEIDDFYLLDASGTTNNAPLLTAPRIETTFPVSDSSVQYAFGAGQVGSSIRRSTGVDSISANGLWLIPVRPAINCTLTGVSLLPDVTQSTVNLRGVVYGDSSGIPGSLLSSGSTVTGMVADTPRLMPLTTPQSLVAGTQYWIGFMNDIQITSGMKRLDGSVNSRRATVTFSSGAPASAPATSTDNTTIVFGNISNPGVNWYEVSRPTLLSPAQSYVTDNVIGHEDLYNFAPLSVNPAAIHAAAVHVLCSRTDTGTLAVAPRMRSGATTVAGPSVPIALSSNTVSGYFESDPTGTAWTEAVLNAATSGVRIES